MYITPNTISMLNFILNKYHTKINVFDQKLYDYILPTIKKRKNHFFNDLKYYKQHIKQIIYYTMLFLESDLKEFKYFYILDQLISEEYTNTSIYTKCKNTTNIIPYMFTFSFNFLNLYHYLHRDIRLVAGITTNPQKYKAPIINNKFMILPKYDTIYFFHYQILFENRPFFHSEQDTPKGYSLQFDTEDLPLIKWMIKNAKLRQKMIKLRDKSKNDE